MDGMFSIQVLSKALESWGLRVMSLESEEARALKAAPTTAEAFICNLQEHWFTLRRVASGDWWNFNSLFPAPQPLSTFFLQAFLDSLRAEGWTIFVVVGKLPVAQPGALESLPNASGQWWSPDEARAATEEAERARKRGRVANALETALARAGQDGSLTLRTRHGAGAAAGPSGAGAQDDEDADLAAAIAASLEHAAGPGPSPAAGGAGPSAGAAAAGPSGRGASPAPGPAPAGAADTGAYGGGAYGSGAYGSGEEFEHDDPELAMAIAASLAEAGGGGQAALGAAGAAEAAAQRPQQQPEEAAEALEGEPEEGEGVIEVAFRLPSGSRVSRRFPQAARAAQLFAFLGPQLGVPPRRVALSTQFPKKELAYGDATLTELGLSHRTLLVAEPKKA